MGNKKFVKIFFIFLFLITVSIFIYLKFFKEKELNVIQEKNNEIIYNSNLIKDVEYSTKDKDGNWSTSRLQKAQTAAMLCPAATRASIKSSSLPTKRSNSALNF